MTDCMRNEAQPRTIDTHDVKVQSMFGVDRCVGPSAAGPGKATCVEVSKRQPSARSQVSLVSLSRVKVVLQIPPENGVRPSCGQPGRVHLRGR